MAWPRWSQNFIVLRPHWKGYLAEALAMAGHVQEGLDTLDEALEQAERTGEGFAEAELHRLGENCCCEEQLHCRRPGGGMLPGLAGRSRVAAGQSWELRAAQPGEAAEGAGPPQAEAPGDAGGGLSLVHRGFRHPGFEGGQGLARES